MGHFYSWVAYAIFHGLIVYFLCFWILTLPGLQQPDGKDIGFWIFGHVVYGGCVLVANF